MLFSMVIIPLFVSIVALSGFGCGYLLGRSFHQEVKEGIRTLLIFEMALFFLSAVLPLLFDFSLVSALFLCVFSALFFIRLHLSSASRFAVLSTLFAALLFFVSADQILFILESSSIFLYKIFAGINTMRR